MPDVVGVVSSAAAAMRVGPCPALVRASLAIDVLGRDVFAEGLFIAF